MQTNHILQVNSLSYNIDNKDTYPKSSEDINKKVGIKDEKK